MSEADQKIIGLLKSVLEQLEQKIVDQARNHIEATAQQAEAMAQQLEKLERIEKLIEPSREPLPLEDKLWDSEDVAHYLKRNTQVVRERIASLPSFPKAIRLPSSGRARPLYIAGEVIAWAKKQKEKN